MNKIISNTSPIIALSIIGKLDLLWRLFDEVYVARAVYDEILASQTRRLKGKEELKEAINRGDIRLYDVIDELFVAKMTGKLHQGEVETIVGGRELNTDFVLIDEKAARVQAINYFLVPIGTLGILKIAKQRRMIKEIKPYLDKLVVEKYRISKNIYRIFLESVGESD